MTIDVEVDGRAYQELHADGGTTSQVFLYPAGIDWERVLEMGKAGYPWHQAPPECDDLEGD